MIAWILLTGLNVVTLFWALRLWRRLDEERGLNDYLDETAQYWEEEAKRADVMASNWKALYLQAKRDQIREEGDWWK